MEHTALTSSHTISVEPTNQKKRRPLKNLPPDRFQPKMTFIWLTILAAVFAVYYYFGQNRMTMVADLKIQQVVDLTTKGEVTKGEIRDEGAGLMIIRGETKDPIEADGVKTTHFNAMGRLTDSSLAILQKSEKFDEPPAQTFMMNIISAIAVPLLIIGVLYFIFV
ncbi:MAG TPA: hypothetical protein VNV14_06080, partial [Opitutaceae bacterium]|nr:hypothetical protein [Opitutaceae bacterium]